MNVSPAWHHAPFSFWLGYEWRVGVRQAGRSLLDGGGFQSFDFLDAPPGCFYADPFVIEHSGSTYLFVEEYRYQERRGVLCCLALDSAGRPMRREVILEAPCHLSYPFVFQHDGEMFLLPETAAARCVELYRAIEFPWRWRRCRTILDAVEAADSTILFHENRVWLFTALGGQNDQLHLFCADSLFDRFVPHRANPVVVDASCARPAGRICRRGDLLIRPAQDCRKCYGNRIRFQSILVLDAAMYRESEVGATPEQCFGSNCGTHTYNYSEHWEVLDVCFHGIHGPAIQEHISRMAGFLKRDGQPRCENCL